MITVVIGTFTTNVGPAAIPLRVSSQSTVVVHSPRQDLVVLSKCDAMHAACCDLNDSDGRFGEVGVQARPQHVIGGASRPESKYARVARAEDVNVESIDCALVENRFGFWALRFFGTASGSFVGLGGNVGRIELARFGDGGRRGGRLLSLALAAASSIIACRFGLRG